MSDAPHIADAEKDFYIIAVGPDVCRVGKKIVAYEPSQKLHQEKSAYSKTVFARDEKVLMVDSIIKGLIGNAGKGVYSGVAVKKGHSKILPNQRTVWVEDKQVAADGDEVMMNGKNDDGPSSSEQQNIKSKSSKDASKKSDPKDKEGEPLSKEQKATVDADRKQAREWLEKRKESLERWNETDRAEFKAAFGTDSQEARQLMTDRTNGILRAESAGQFNYVSGSNLPDPATGVSSEAYVRGFGSNPNVYLNEGYFNLPGGNAEYSRSHVLIHEWSHLRGTSDYLLSTETANNSAIYGFENSRDLVRWYPRSVLQHADSYAFWVSPRPSGKPPGFTPGK
jgi:hypothetical protein